MLTDCVVDSSVHHGDETHTHTPPDLSSSLSLCSEEPVSLQILLTNSQTDQPAASLQDTPPPCFIKPLPPHTNSLSDPASSTDAPATSPREESRGFWDCGGPSSRMGEPLSRNSASLPALCVESWEHSPLGDLAPPTAAKEADHSAQCHLTPPVSIPPSARATPTSRPYTRTPSPINNRRHTPMEEEPCYPSCAQATPPGTSTAPGSRLAPPSPTYPTRKWSCLSLDKHDIIVSPVDPPLSPTSHPPPGSHAACPLPSRTVRTPSPPTHQDYIAAALPVEHWAENVNQYYGSQNAAGGGGGASLNEEPSELDCLYQASLLAPSMPRGSRGVSPQPTGNKPGMITSTLPSVSASCSILQTQLLLPLLLLP